MYVPFDEQATVFHLSELATFVKELPLFVLNEIKLLLLVTPNITAPLCDMATLFQTVFDVGKLDHVVPLSLDILSCPP
jgi:hypothetical protein